MNRTATIIDRDRGYKDRLKKIAEAGSHRVNVGIQGDEASAVHRDGGGLTTGQIAGVHEFGMTISRNLRIPERSWLRGWFDGAVEKNRQTLKTLATLVVQGKVDEARALEIAGAVFKGDIQARIARGIPPPNAPSTIARKGSSTPLIWTGQLRAGVTYKVVHFERLNVAGRFGR